MTCRDCLAARDTDGLWWLYDSPKCLYCTARLIQRIGKTRSPTSAEIAARRRVVLADAVAWGHSEAEIRELASKKVLAAEPLPEGKRK